jgi:hypothetical protein
MPEYRVRVREVHIQDVKIEADSPEEAKAKVCNADGDYQNESLIYHDTLPPETWEVLPWEDKT